MALTYKEHLVKAADELALSHKHEVRALETATYQFGHAMAELSLAAATRANYHVQMARLLSVVRVDVLS